MYIIPKFTAAEWLALLAVHGGACLRCGTTKRIEPDHIIPLYLGGENTINNIQPLCRSCNASKGVAIIDYRRISRQPESMVDTVMQDVHGARAA